MGVDVGQARVGVALCDREGILATPLKTLRRDSKNNSDIRVLLKLVEVHSVVEIFLGLPMTMRGGQSQSNRMALDYAHTLEQQLSIPLWLIDERLTTVKAKRTLHEAGVSSRHFKAMVDQVAAVNILQVALDALKAGNPQVGQSLAAYTARTSSDNSRYGLENKDTENPSER